MRSGGTLLKGSICAFIFLLVVLSGKLYAHRPLFVKTDITELENARAIPDPEISRGIYAELAPGKAHFYQFVLQEDQEFFAQMLVPTRPRYKDFRPTLALIGPGLPAPAAEIPFALPPNTGVLILPWEDKEVFFEPFTQTRYYMARELRRALTAGTWQLAVYQPEGKGGKYTLAVGEKEQWRIKDIFAFPAIWFRTRWWYSPGQTIAIILAAPALAAFLVWLLLRFLK